MRFCLQCKFRVSAIHTASTNGTKVMLNKFYEKRISGATDLGNGPTVTTKVLTMSKPKRSMVLDNSYSNQSEKSQRQIN